MIRLIAYLPVAMLACANILLRLQPESWIPAAIVGALCGGGAVFVAALMDVRDEINRLCALRVRR